MKKLFFGILVAGSIIFPTQASAGSLGDNLGFNIVEVTETAVRKNANKILDELWKSAVLMEESKLCIAEALEFDPRYINTSQEILRDLNFNRKDMNAIRKSIYHKMPEYELQARIEKLKTINDQTKSDQFSKLLKRSKDIRVAAYSYNSDAIGNIVKTLEMITNLHDINPSAEDRLNESFLSQIKDSCELLYHQRRQMKMFYKTFNAIEKKLNIETPSRKELKQIEREILPK